MNSREDEMRALFYHSASYHRQSRTRRARQSHHIAIARGNPRIAGTMAGYFDRPDRMDDSTTEAISKYEFAYGAPHVDIGWLGHETGVPTGWYRAVSYIPNVFAVESFLDEAAHAAQRDLVDFCLAHMKDPRRCAARKGCAGRPGQAVIVRDRARFGDESGVQQLCGARRAGGAQGQRRDDREAHVRRGLRMAVSLAGVEEQLYGGLMWGLGHATAARIDIRHGQGEQKNFDTYRVMRMSDMPEIDIRIVQGDPGKPAGVGELSSPSVAPAVANAVFRLTGTRLRNTSFDVRKVVAGQS